MKRDLIFYGAIAAAAILVLYILSKKKTQKTQQPAAPMQTAATGSQPSAGSQQQPSPTPDANRNLYKGVQAPLEVKALQMRLNAQGFNLVVDGIFGEQTRQALSQATMGQYDEITLNQFDQIFTTQAAATGGSAGTGTGSSAGTTTAADPNAPWLYDTPFWWVNPFGSAYWVYNAVNS